MTKASLGLLYKQQRNYERALPLFQNIAESLGKFFQLIVNIHFFILILDTKTQSFRWINMVLESLIECYSHIEAKQDEDSFGARSAADRVQSELYEWRRGTMKRPNIINLIHQEPTRSLEQFIHDVTKFQRATDRLHALLHSQQKAKKSSTIIHQET